MKLSDAARCAGRCLWGGRQEHVDERTAPPVPKPASRMPSASLRRVGAPGSFPPPQHPTLLWLCPASSRNWGEQGAPRAPDEGTTCWRRPTCLPQCSEMGSFCCLLNSFHSTALFYSLTFVLIFHSFAFGLICRLSSRVLLVFRNTSQ